MEIIKEMCNLLINLGYQINEDELAKGDIDLRNFVMDSIEFVTLVVEIENAFDIEMPDEFLDFDILAFAISVLYQLSVVHRFLFFGTLVQKRCGTGISTLNVPNFLSHSRQKPPNVSLVMRSPNRYYSTSGGFSFAKASFAYHW